MMQSARNIDTYIARYPKDVQAKLKEIRTAIRKLAPKATEKISYGIPTFMLNGNLVHFAAYKTHIGFYPGASAIAKFKKDIAKYPTSKGTIQLPLNKALPLPLIRKIVQFRIAENTAKVMAKAPKGMHIVYHKDGSIWAKGKLSGDMPHGYWEWFRKTGTKMRSGYFNKGTQTGTWTTYDTKGKAFKTTDLDKKKR